MKIESALDKCLQGFTMVCTDKLNFPNGVKLRYNSERGSFECCMNEKVDMWLATSFHTFKDLDWDYYHQPFEKGQLLRLTNKKDKSLTYGFFGNYDTNTIFIKRVSNHDNADYYNLNNWDIEPAEIVMQSPLIRSELQSFVMEMEKQLKANEHKGGWDKCDDGDLLGGLDYNMGMLMDILTRPLTESSRPHIIRWCANLANFAMMIADNARKTEGK